MPRRLVAQLAHAHAAAAPQLGAILAAAACPLLLAQLGAASV